MTVLPIADEVDVVGVIPFDFVLATYGSPGTAAYLEAFCAAVRERLDVYSTHEQIELASETFHNTVMARDFADKAKDVPKATVLLVHETLRRVERHVGQLIRMGQEAGVIRTPADGRQTAVNLRLGLPRPIPKKGPTDYLPYSALKHHESGIYRMVDGVSAEKFEAAIAQARQEGNLSRHNVIRKIRGEIQQPKVQRSDYNRKRRHLDPAHIFEETINTLEGVAMSLDLIDLNEVGEETKATWEERLAEAVAPITRFRRDIL